MSVGSGRDAVVAAARRSPRHSSLFWFLFDQHDELIEAKKQSGLGIPWESMLARFAALNLTLCQGKAITARAARQTFLRVQKKKARLAALEANAEAARAFERARDPRRTCRRVSRDRSRRRCPTGSLPRRRLRRRGSPRRRRGQRSRSSETELRAPRSGNAGRSGADGRLRGQASGRVFHGGVQGRAARYPAVHQAGRGTVLGVAGGGRRWVGAGAQATVVGAF